MKGRRRPLRHAGFRVLRCSAIPLLVRQTIQRRRVTLVLYHDPDPRAFERHLRVLRERYTIIDLRSFVDALRHGTLGRLPRNAMVITCDDGHRGNRALLPILQRLEVPVTVFLCASIAGTRRRFWFQHVDDPAALKLVSDGLRLELLDRNGFIECGEEPEALSGEEFQAMAGPLVDFQSHGLSHAILPRCDEAKARAEIVNSRAALSSRYGLEIYAFSYPNGSYSERELRLVREAGYLCGVTTNSGFNDARTDPYRLKRICIDDGDGVDALLVKASGVWAAIRRLVSLTAVSSAEPDAGPASFTKSLWSRRSP